MHGVVANAVYVALVRLLKRSKCSIDTSIDDN